MKRHIVYVAAGSTVAKAPELIFEAREESRMILMNRTVADPRALFARCIRRIIFSMAVICLAHLSVPLWGQWPTTGTTSPGWTGGNVGIGTPTPNGKLEVNSAGTNGGMLLYSGGSTNYTFLALGRTGAEALIGMAGGAGQFSPAAVAGDLIIRSEGKNIMFSTDATGATNQMYLQHGGNIGIGTTNPGQCGASYTPPCLLTVNGAIAAKEVIVTNGITADYVFKPDYRLTPLTEVASFIQKHHHLPEIPSEAEVKENGISVGDMQVKLLAKVEELTLHLIQADEKNRELQQRIERLEAGAR